MNIQNRAHDGRPIDRPADYTEMIIYDFGDGTSSFESREDVQAIRIWRWSENCDSWHLAYSRAG